MDHKNTDELIIRIAEELLGELQKRPITFLNVKLEHETDKEKIRSGMSGTTYVDYLMHPRYGSEDQIILFRKFTAKYGLAITQKCLDHILDR